MLVFRDDFNEIDMIPLSKKLESKPVIPKVIGFREKIEKEKAEKEQQEATFARLQSLAVQHSTHHPNLSMGTKNDDESSSDSGWED